MIQTQPSWTAMRIPPQLLRLPSIRKLLLFEEGAGTAVRDHARRAGEQIAEFEVFCDLGGETSAFATINGVSGGTFLAQVGALTPQSVTLSTPADINALVALIDLFETAGDHSFKATALRVGGLDPSDLALSPVRQCYGAANTLTFGRTLPDPLITGGEWRTNEGFPFVQLLKANEGSLNTGLNVGGWASGTMLILHRSPTDPSNGSGLFSDILPDGAQSLSLVGVIGGTNLSMAKVSSLGAEALHAPAGTYDYTSEWKLDGCDWGPLGMRIFQNGEVVASNTELTGTNDLHDLQVLNWYAGSPVLWGNMDVAFFGAWEEQFPVAVHRRLQEGRRRP